MTHQVETQGWKRGTWRGSQSKQRGGVVFTGDRNVPADGLEAVSVATALCWHWLQKYHLSLTPNWALCNNISHILQLPSVETPWSTFLRYYTPMLAYNGENDTNSYPMCLFFLLIFYLFFENLIHVYSTFQSYSPALHIPLPALHSPFLQLTETD